MYAGGVPGDVEELFGGAFAEGEVVEFVLGIDDDGFGGTVVDVGEEGRVAGGPAVGGEVANVEIALGTEGAGGVAEIVAAGVGVAFAAGGDGGAGDQNQGAAVLERLTRGPVEPAREATPPAEAGPAVDAAKLGALIRRPEPAAPVETEGLAETASGAVPVDDHNSCVSGSMTVKSDSRRSAWVATNNRRPAAVFTS